MQGLECRDEWGERVSSGLVLGWREEGSEGRAKPNPPPPCRGQGHGAGGRVVVVGGASPELLTQRLPLGRQDAW